MKKLIFSIVILGFSNFILAQKYEFKSVIDLSTSSVKNQGKTGTCWSFSSSSFIESEIERLSGMKIDVSEMYSVRTTYDDKAYNYIMRQGKSQFSEGGLAHDVLNAIAKNGLVPQEAFTGLFGQAIHYNHSKIVPDLKNILDQFIKNDSTINNWKEPVTVLLNKNIGNYIETFEYQGKTYNPKEFLSMTHFNPDNYLTVTSFTHKPNYSEFILDIPDNFSNGSFYNFPLNEYMEVIDYALIKGFTIELDIDVSEPTFSSITGVAIIPANKKENKKALTELVKELNITPNYRQAEFENYNTTDDHLMHITGILKDQKGNKYYKVKNSWGTSSANGGFVYISESYMQLKSISIMIHKDALSKKIKKKIHI